MATTLHSKFVKLKTELVKKLDLEKSNRFDLIEIIDQYLKYAMAIGYDKALKDVAEGIDIETYLD